MINKIKAYITGNYRYRLFYSKYFYWLIRNHIQEQIEIRIKSMDNKCYIDGSCKMCGCITTALQMANKACDKPCYPKMQDKKTWNKLKNYQCHIVENDIMWKVENNKFKQIK